MAKVRWLFVDLNSYFASVEQEMNPKLRGRPVAVVPVMADSTSCIAASIEAKTFGVKTGTRVSDAKKMCPGIVLIEAAHEKYVHYHHAIIEAVDSCLPVAAILSIDEMACRLSGSQENLEKAVALAHQVKQAIYTRAGKNLRCSIGLAPNRFLAKVASDMQKPDGLVSILESEIPQKLLPLKLKDFPGIGYNMERRLHRAGVRTTTQLYDLSQAEIKKIWGGIPGVRFWHWLRGHDWDEPETTRRSVGHSHVLPPELRSREGSHAVLQKLLHKAAARLRRYNLWAGGLSLSVSFLNDFYWDDKISLIECQDTLSILEAFQVLWERIPQGHTPYKVGVTLYNLVPDNLHTLSLFQEQKRTALAQAMDLINTKHGKDSVYFGGIHKVRDSAPTRIAFTNVPELPDF